MPSRPSDFPKSHRAPAFAGVLAALASSRLLALSIALSIVPSATARAQNYLRPSDINALPSKPADARVTYGADSLQFGELRLPSGKGPFAVAIVIHGGCWVHGYAAANNAAPIADALRDAGVATWNVEYRRRDNPGGGWPGTFLDVASAADALRGLAARYPLDLTRVIAVGHSAGGQMALWLAARPKLGAGSPLRVANPLPIAGVVALAGPGDLYDFNTYGDGMCGEGTIPKLLGGSPTEVPDRWRDASPSNWLPLGVPQVMIAGEADRIMPRKNLDLWGAAARAKGDSVEIIVVPKAGHHEVMSPQSVTWPAIRDAVLRLSNARPGSAQTSERWWRDVERLSHDSMAGRQTGSKEHRQTAEYVANAFARAGLRPAGTNGYFQPVRFLSRTIDESRSALTLLRDGKEESLTLGQDAAFVLRAPLAASVEAPLVFAGYGLQLPEYGVDDLTGLDVKGKVVVYMTQMPKGVPGPVISHSRAQSWETFRKLGAVGVITFGGSRTNDAAFTRASANRLAPQLTLDDASLDAQRGNSLSLGWNAARAAKLFDGAAEPYAAIAARADSGLKLPRFNLPVRIRSRVALVTGRVTSDNVLGLFPGSDPQLKDEVVVLTAHLDHVGIGRAVNGDSIYNGAMDNASGTALLMEMARRLQEGGTKLRRSVLFAAVTAEEKGLLGSRYLANHPTVKAERIVANLNTDMFMPIVPLTRIMVNGLEESDLAADARAAGEALGLAVVSDPEPEENRFIRSDQYSFILRGIPSLSFKVGFALDTPEHEAVKAFRATRYHFPQDDVTQHVDQATAEGFTRYYLDVVKRVADRDRRPRWHPDSFFRRLAPGM
ncbi:MAG: alpha/beta fold hydrolase [Gemmatimonadetes bacterium]|nr:alpha/beta fold hydrolase [Gemmatimonadota bacterium]